MISSPVRQVTAPYYNAQLNMSDKGRGRKGVVQYDDASSNDEVAVGVVV